MEGYRTGHMTVAVMDQEHTCDERNEIMCGIIPNCVNHLKVRYTQLA